MFVECLIWNLESLGVRAAWTRSRVEADWAGMTQAPILGGTEHKPSEPSRKPTLLGVEEMDFSHSLLNREFDYMLAIHIREVRSNSFAIAQDPRPVRTHKKCAGVLATLYGRLNQLFFVHDLHLSHDPSPLYGSL